MGHAIRSAIISSFLGSRPADRRVSPASHVHPGPVKELLIKGVTRDGNSFRPSDWADRLCGVMAVFRPDASASRATTTS